MTSRKLAALLVAVFFLLVAAAPAQNTVAVRLDLSNVGAQIPADFVGLSFEMQRVLADTNGWHYFSATNRPLIATFKTLGIKNLRVGGNTADRPTLPVPGESDVDNLFAFARAADVQVIYTLRLNQGSLDGAVKMANYITRHYPDHLDCFAIGNEPNVFSTNYDVYVAEWQRYAAQITAASNSPGAKFCGPSVSPGHEKWSAQFAADVAHTGWLKFISQHDYPGGDARRSTNAALTRDRILSPAMEEHYAKFAANFVPTVISNSLTYRFEEANSLYDGGAPDVSDTFTSALWALNYQWWWAMHGMSGINFHTGDKVAARDENKPCRYAAFWTVPGGYNVHPLGYAEKMFSLGSGGRLVPTKITTVDFPPRKVDFNLAAYAVAAPDKSYYITLINQTSGDTATNLTVILGVKGVNGWTKGEVIRLAAPGGDVSAKTGITLGGAEITDTAAWDGQWQPVAVPPEKFQFPIRVELPAASAALVHLTPK
ncbi:MAG TPA: glycosyl hydrolase family 79 C-terminal domain-containing protein [Verrucomicrobiae bacterium]|nr:glycosyl hydrolase family 79 C-terminal domain-containing protein [Verrucomicrobiae bacterium]